MAEKTTILPITLELEDATLVKRVGSSSQGTVRTRIPFDLPALQKKWQGLSREVQHYRSRHAIATEIQTNDDKAYKEAARELGKALFKAIFTDAGEYQNSYALFKKLSPTRGSDKHLLLQLECNDPNVQALPWELLNHEGKFLALDKDFSLVRYIEQSNSKAVLDVPTPLRVLFVAANPQNCNQLELEQEYHQLQKLLRDAEINGIIELDHLFHATLPKLQEKLADDDYHVLHFAGHASHEGYLLFENDKQQSKQISAEDLAPQLQNHRSLALVVLNACESGTASDSFTPFAGIAQKLAQRNIPAVLAMQLVISDPSAIRFSSNFYQDLSRDGDVGKALTNARVAIQSSSSEWLTPVLYSRADDLRLLRIRPLNEAEKVERIERLKGKFLTARKAEDWLEAAILVDKLKVIHDGVPPWLQDMQEEVDEGVNFLETFEEIERLIGVGKREDAKKLARGSIKIATFDDSEENTEETIEDVDEASATPAETEETNEGVNTLSAAPIESVAPTVKGQKRPQRVPWVSLALSTFLLTLLVSYGLQQWQSLPVKQDQDNVNSYNLRINLLPADIAFDDVGIFVLQAPAGSSHRRNEHLATINSTNNLVAIDKAGVWNIQARELNGTRLSNVLSFNIPNSVATNSQFSLAIELQETP